MINKICVYFFIFMIYSVCGWLMETLLFVVRDKKIVKRGFLFGPLCPIYGFGAIICTALMYGKVNNIFLVFLYGMLLCGTLEYLTHFLLEKIFHAMWWDYSCRRFNIKGRVYLKGLLTFGLGVVLIIKVFQPLIFKLIDLMSMNAVYIICFVLYTILIIDLAFTISYLKSTANAIKYVQGVIIEKSQNAIDVTGEKLNEILNSESVSGVVKYLKYDNSFVKHIKGKYPNVKIDKYKQILDIVLDRPIEENARTDIKLYGTADTIPSADNDD